MRSEIEVAKTLLEVIPPLVRKIRSEIRRAAPRSLTVAQFRVLGNIYLGTTTVTELAEHHLVSQPAMTKMVNGLVKRGLVQRKTSQKDERRTILNLTPKGKRIRNATWKLAEERLASKLRSIPPNERKLLIRTLLNLRSTIASAQPNVKKNTAP